MDWGVVLSGFIAHICRRLGAFTGLDLRILTAEFIFMVGFSSSAAHWILCNSGTVRYVVHCGTIKVVTPRFCILCAVILRVPQFVVVKFKAVWFVYPLMPHVPGIYAR
jgi:hypothetical protein